MRLPIIRNFVPDKTAISIVYRFRFHRKLNWENPKSFNEKLLWLTVYDRKPIYSTLVDKYEAKKWMSERLIRGYICSIAPTFGVYNNFDEIDFDTLPDSFVIKATYDSGTVKVISDKSKIDYAKLRKFMKKGLSKNYYWYTREWPYKNVKPRIIIEKKLESCKGVPEDYKIFCFYGKAKFWFFASDRDKDVKFDYCDMEFNRLPFVQGHPNSDYMIKMPACWNQMIEVAECLSNGFPHMRVVFL